MILVYTYATHNEGMFDELIKNKYTKENVVGYGSKWNGFFDKIQKMYSEFEKLQPDTLVMFVDGFDTRIIKNLEIAEERYKQFYPKNPVLFSSETILEIPFGSYIQRRVFGEGPIANTGLYMGPVNKIMNIMNKSIKFKKECKDDDQCAYNKIREDFEIDNDYHIFQNVNYSQRKDENFSSDAVVLQFPGQLTPNRIIRSIKEYTPFFWKEILFLVILILLVFFIVKKYRKNNQS